MTGYESKRAAARDKLEDDDTQEREALKLALEFVEDVNFGEWQGSTERQEEIITAIKEALAQPAQEPVAWMHVQGNYKEPSFRELADDEVERGWKQYPLYTTPPQRPWVGLTDDEFKKIIDDAGFTRTDLLMIGACVEQLVDLLEATLRSKNT